MAVRKIIHIDEEKCNGCGLCIPKCAEGALQIIDGKAKLISEKYCDGLGACLGHCPQGAITIVEREAETFDEAAVAAHLAQKNNKEEETFRGCPALRPLDLNREKDVPAAENPSSCQSCLGNWPLQLKLVHPEASYFSGAHLLVAADCVPFAYPDFHRDLLQNRTVVVGCPKLDDLEEYLAKLTAIVKANDLRHITVAYMEIPCCLGLVHVVQEAVRQAGKEIPLDTVPVNIQGK